MSLEASLWHWLSGARKTFGASLHMNRIENPLVPGMPDVEGYLENAGQFWLELKAAKRPARRETPIRFKVRDKQIDWIDHRWKLGANVFWFLQIGSGHERRLLLAPGPLGPKLQSGLYEDALIVESVPGILPKNVLPADVLRKVFSCRKSLSLSAASQPPN
jgi:hypothetical protein